MGWRDTLKNALIESDEKPATKKDQPAPLTAVPASKPMVLPESGDLYQHLLEQTRYESTPVGTSIHKYYETLASTPLDDAAKLKTAIDLAKKLDHITDDAILSAFTTVKESLEHEEDSYSEVASDATATILNDQKKLEELNAEVLRLTKEIAERQSRLSVTSTQFKSAAARRRTEIEQDLARYTAALKG